MVSSTDSTTFDSEKVDLASVSPTTLPPSVPSTVFPTTYRPSSTDYVFEYFDPTVTDEYLTDEEAMIKLKGKKMALCKINTKNIVMVMPRKV